MHVEKIIYTSFHTIPNHQFTLDIFACARLSNSGGNNTIITYLRTSITRRLVIPLKRTRLKGGYTRDKKKVWG